MAKVIVGAGDKMYRNLYLEAEGFADGLEYDWKNKAKNLTTAQKEIIQKLGHNDWHFEIDDDGALVFSGFDKSHK